MRGQSSGEEGRRSLLLIQSSDSCFFLAPTLDPEQTLLLLHPTDFLLSNLLHELHCSLQSELRGLLSSRDHNAVNRLLGESSGWCHPFSLEAMLLLSVPSPDNNGWEATLERPFTPTFSFSPIFSWQYYLLPSGLSSPSGAVIAVLAGLWIQTGCHFFIQNAGCERSFVSKSSEVPHLHNCLPTDFKSAQYYMLLG